MIPLSVGIGLLWILTIASLALIYYPVDEGDQLIVYLFILLGYIAAFYSLHDGIKEYKNPKGELSLKRRFFTIVLLTPVALLIILLIYFSYYSIFINHNLPTINAIAGISLLLILIFYLSVVAYGVLKYRIESKKEES